MQSHCKKNISEEKVIGNNHENLNDFIVITTAMLMLTKLNLSQGNGESALLNLGSLCCFINTFLVNNKTVKKISIFLGTGLFFAGFPDIAALTSVNHSNIFNKTM